MRKFLIVIMATVMLTGCETSDSKELKSSEITSESSQASEILSTKEEMEEPESQELSLTDIYNNFKSEMDEIAREVKFSDEMTRIMKLGFESSFGIVNNMDIFSDNKEHQDEFAKFVQAISYFELNFGEGTAENQIGIMGWDAIYSLIMDDGKFKSKMSDLKEYYETNISSIYATKYESGQYKVGTDIPAGEYVIFADGGPGYFEVTSDSNGDDIIANENFEYNSIMTIKDGEYIELSRAYAVPIEEVESLPTDKADMFKIGTFLPSGEYKVVSDSGSGYYCIYGDDRQDNIIANDNFEGQSYITVSEGEYLVLSRCHIEE